MEAKIIPVYCILQSRSNNKERGVYCRNEHANCPVNDFSQYSIVHRCFNVASMITRANVDTLLSLFYAFKRFLWNLNCDLCIVHVHAAVKVFLLVEKNGLVVLQIISLGC